MWRRRSLLSQPTPQTQPSLHKFTLRFAESPYCAVDPAEHFRSLEMTSTSFMLFRPSSLDTPGRPLYYDVLPPDYIRLLQPIAGGWDPKRDKQPQLCFSMHYCALKDAPDYAALSYCWGSAQKSYRILVNQQYLPITQNLDLALRDLLRYHSVTFLWVDAICINQSDTSERSRQVQLMGEIFSRADIVLAYLGQERYWTRSAFAAFRSDSGGRPLVTDEALSSVVGTNRRPTLHPVELLLKVGYWTRTWIVQGKWLAVDRERRLLRTLRIELCGLISCQSSFWLASSIFSPADAISAARIWPCTSKIHRQPEQLCPTLKPHRSFFVGLAIHALGTPQQATATSRICSSTKPTIPSVPTYETRSSAFSVSTIVEAHWEAMLAL